MTRSVRLLAVIASVLAMVGAATVANATNDEPLSFAFVARGDNPVDALAAAPVGGRLDAPVVLTEPTSLNAAARTKLLEIDPDVVVIAGGTTAVSSSVETAIESLLPDAEVRRVEGGTRYETAAALADLFDEYDPAHLPFDGKANAAELADLATLAEHAETADLATLAEDSEMFGGLTPSEYQFSIVDRQGEVLEGTAPDRDPDVTGEQVAIKVLDDITFTAPVDGVIDVTPLGASDSGNLVLALLDATEADVLAILGVGSEPDGSASDEELAAAFDKLVGVAQSFLSIPNAAFVEAGEHTVSLYGFGTAEETYQFFLRSLVVSYSSGVEGDWEPFEIPPTEARRQMERFMEQMQGS